MKYQPLRLLLLAVFIGVGLGIGGCRVALAPTVTAVASATRPSPAPLANTGSPEVAATPIPATPTATSAMTATAVATASATAVASPSPTLLSLPATLPTPLPVAATLEPGTVPVAEEVSFSVVDQLGGRITTVGVADPAVYLGAGPRLLTLDVGDPNRPRLLNQSPLLPDNVVQIAVQDNRLFLANGAGGLRIFDASEPATLREIGAIAGVDGEAVYFSHVALSGSTAYVINQDFASETAELLIFDAGDPGQPRRLSSLALADLVHRMVVHGGVVYLAYQGSIEFIDVTNVTAPAKMDNTAVPAGAYAMATDGNGVYAARTESPGYSQLWDVTSPARPQQLFEFFPIHLADLLVAGDYVYGLSQYGEFAGCDANLHFTAASPAASPKEMAALPLPDCVHSLAHEGDYLYAISEKGLRIFSIGDSGTPVRVSQWDVPSGISSVNDILSYPGYAYLVGYDAAAGETLAAVDTSRVAEPRPVGRPPQVIGSLEPAIPHLAPADGYFYVSEGSQLTPWDVDDPAEPQQGEAVTVVMANAATAVGDYIYVMGYASLTVLDGQKPGQPTVLNRLPLVASPVELSVPAVVANANGYLLASIDDEANRFIYIFEITRPAEPLLVSLVSVPAPVTAVTMAEPYAYIAMRDGSFWILDVTNPAAPASVGTLAIPGGAAQVILAPAGRHPADRILYVAAYGTGLWAVNASDPGRPYLAGHLDLPGSGVGLVAIENLLYVATGQSGLFLVEPK